MILRCSILRRSRRRRPDLNLLHLCQANYYYKLNKHQNNNVALLCCFNHSCSYSYSDYSSTNRSVKKKNGLIRVTSTSLKTITETHTTSQAISVAAAEAPLITSQAISVAAAEAPLITTWSTALTLPPDLRRVKRSDFPPDFHFGGSTSALQTEGAGAEGGRGPSTWDFTIGAGNKAANSYNLWKEDVEVMKKMGMNSYRMSISWPRILPKGTIRGGINQEGIDFYNNFIDELIANEINPMVTLFHFDMPQALQDEYHGFLSKRIIKDFQAYAELCFKTFGDRVKLWATINEPSVVVGYNKSIGITPELARGSNSYKAIHNVLLAHAAAARAYKQNYQVTQGGEVGISLSFKWLEPLSDSPKDNVAAQNAIDFEVGWYMNPLCYGDYPKIMKDKLVGLPVFTMEESELVKGSYDWIGINYYTARYVTLAEYSTVDHEKGHMKVFHVEEKVNRNGVLIGPLAPGSTDCYIYPDGLRDALLYMKNKYNDPLLYITENGITSDLDIKMSIKEAMAAENKAAVDKALIDNHRVDHIIIHLLAIREAINKGATVKGYFVWSMLDSLEFPGRYNNRTGLCYTDYLDNHKRYLKKSGEWFYKFNTLKANKFEVNIVGQRRGIELLTLLACVSIYAWIMYLLTTRR